MTWQKILDKMELLRGNARHFERNEIMAELDELIAEVKQKIEDEKLRK